MRARHVAACAALILVAGCTGTGTNSMPVFTAVGGVQKLLADVLDRTDITSVDFLIDGGQPTQILLPDTNGADGWSVDFDTTKVANGVHFVKAIGKGGAEEVELLNNSILINNPLK